MQPETEIEETPVEEIEEEVASSVEEEEEEIEEPASEETEEESEVEEEEEEEPKVADREFDKNPTVLYALVQKKLWKEAIARAKSNPEEAEAFIVRKEKDGSTRWRLLPLHAAIVFKAPEGVIEALLTAYPKGAEQKDDQEMLPLHLAFRNGASEEIVNLLLLAFPDSVDSPDRKGRVPLTLAKNSDSPNRELYIAALEKGASHYYVTAIALARERVVAEEKTKYDAQLEDALKLHQTAFTEMSAKHEEKHAELEAKIAEKDQEIAKIRATSDVMSEQVLSLEAQMGCRSDTERFLATKIAKLEQKVKEGEAKLEEREAAAIEAGKESDALLLKADDRYQAREGEFEVQQAKLTATVEGLEKELEEVKATLASTETKLQESIDTMKEKQDEWDMKVIRGDAKFSKVEIDWANSQANVAILESQLKKRMENEHLLASQVANLAASLAESADSNINFSSELKKFEEEKAALKDTIHLLKMRLAGVVGTMKSTRDQQITILDDSIDQENLMVKVLETHAEIVSESIEQEKAITAAKEEMLALVEKTFATANANRMKFMTLSTTHGESLSSMNTNRTNVLSCAQTVTENVIRALDKELNLDTLDAEVAKLGEQRRPSPAALAKVDVTSIKKVTEEVREEAPVVVEETPAPAPVETTVEETPEVVVVSSPKHVAVVTATPEEESVEEDARTEDASTDSLQVDTRVMAE